MKSTRFFLLLVIMIFLCTNGFAEEPKPRVHMQTSSGLIVLELNSRAAPKTVENFLNYVKSEFYNQTIFHRVIKGFMIQGGGLSPDFKKKKTAPPVINEADNGLKNVRGTIAMARTMNPNSATAQFFINTVDNKSLDFTAKTTQGWGYCVFGRVVEGMDVVDKIESAPTTIRAGRRDVPAETVLIKSIVMESEKE